MRTRISIPATAALLALALLPGAASAGEDEAAKKADQELQEHIDESIDRGAKWLLGTQSIDGSFPSPQEQGYPMGPTALATLALLHSGVPRESSAIRRAFARLRKVYGRIKGSNGQWRGLRTYSVSLTIMALAEYGRDRKLLRKRDEDGGGGVVGGFRLEKQDLEWMQDLTSWLVSVQNGGAWRYPEGGFDNSNSQYALLALKEARRAGLDVPEETFVKALRHFLARQQRKGPRVRRHREVGGDGVYAATRTVADGHDRARGWGYSGADLPSGSMTTAGVAATSICVSEIDEAKYRNLVAEGRQSARDGLAWLGLEFSVSGNPRLGTTWHYYYLYGLERAGVLANVVYMGDHRWYATGARYLVNCQGPDGGWRPGGFAGQPGRPVVDVVDSSFALLFLARATARAVTAVTERPLLDLTAGAELSEPARRDLFAAALREMDDLDDEGRARRARDFAFLGPGVIPLLLPLLADDDEGVRARAILILRAATGLAMDYDPRAKAADREAGADRWTAWYLRNRGKLALDREARRIR